MVLLLMRAIGRVTLTKAGDGRSLWLASVNTHTCSSEFILMSMLFCQTHFAVHVHHLLRKVVLMLLLLLEK